LCHRGRRYPFCCPMVTCNKACRSQRSMRAAAAPYQHCRRDARRSGSVACSLDGFPDRPRKSSAKQCGDVYPVLRRQLLCDRATAKSAGLTTEFGLDCLLEEQPRPGVLAKAWSALSETAKAVSGGGPAASSLTAPVPPAVGVMEGGYRSKAVILPIRRPGTLRADSVALRRCRCGAIVPQPGRTDRARCAPGRDVGVRGKGKGLFRQTPFALYSACRRIARHRD
jgi:hypothetical protein